MRKISVALVLVVASTLVSAPAAGAALKPAGLAAAAQSAPADVVSQVKAKCADKSTPGWVALKVGSVSSRARWINKQFKIGTSKRYTADTARSMRAFERAVKVKVNGVVSARDWCLLREFVDVKRPGNGNGSSGNGGGNGGGRDESPFDTCAYPFGETGEGSPESTLSYLADARFILTRELESSEGFVQGSVWRTSGPRVEQAYVNVATPLLAKVEAAHAALKAAMGTPREKKVWQDALEVWKEARLFTTAQISIWADAPLQNNFGIIVSQEMLIEGSGSAAAHLAHFQQVRDTYAARAGADPTIVAGSDAYLVWVADNYPVILPQVEDLMVKWVQASSVGVTEWRAVLDEVIALENSKGDPLGWVIDSYSWFYILEQGGNPVDYGISLPPSRA